VDYRWRCGSLETGWEPRLRDHGRRRVGRGHRRHQSMPYQITQDAARWLGGPPTYRLALMIGDSSRRRDLAWRIANEFARWWPAVWRDHMAQPVGPLGHWWRR
jgi:hypothetical protein